MPEMAVNKEANVLFALAGSNGWAKKSLPIEFAHF
jgi:hypothetical protein